jgi:hypothetical protein
VCETTVLELDIRELRVFSYHICKNLIQIARLCKYPRIVHTHAPTLARHPGLAHRVKVPRAWP